MPDGAMICPCKNLILGKNEILAPSNVANTNRKLDLSFALLAKNWFTMPSISDKGICGIVMAT
jgi:hypothetical protein